ncbi:patatin-like phospholipase family protein [Actinomadura atramentaria]|uniref:patatin-like phospholipase family protein n=1 Tax=Actinomadura atramentaria TaxID=1990 RepID=UPI00037958FE|nr:patatin-like phospholipase family protein [Actinomadura atramentaria]
MSRAVVLGSGLVAGPLWQAGLIVGMRREGTDLGDADLVVGTSSGGAIAALAAFGDELADAMDDIMAARRVMPMPEVEADQFMRTFRAASPPADEGAAARRKLGAEALAADTASESFRLDPIVDRLPSRAWPDRPLALPTVEVESGERVVWRNGGAGPLPDAVRAACSLPHVFQPVEIGGRHYFDGMAYSFTNADLAAGCDRVLILTPLRHLLSEEALRDDLAGLSPEQTVVIGPDDETRDVFELELFDPRAGYASYRAGLRQAAAQAGEIAAAWAG